jgi:septal ring factor EnvC (AmiA/AmiB activator)
MNDALADNFMAPLREAQARLEAVNAEIANKRKELAALEGECAVARKAMNDLGEQRIELQRAVNSQRTLLSQSQADLTNATAMFEALRKKVASIPITGTRRG